MKPLNRLALALGAPLAIAATLGGAAAFAAQGNGGTDTSTGGGGPTVHELQATSTATPGNGSHDCPHDGGSGGSGSSSNGGTVSPSQY